MSDERPDISATDAMEVAQRALSKVNDLERKLERLSELEEDLTAVKLRLSELDENRPYAEKTLNEKIGIVREHAFNRAREGHGTVSLDYSDIMWEVFDGKPGTKHCYKLIRKAAEAPGFEDRDPANGQRHLFADAERIRDGAAYFPENNGGLREGSR